MDYKEVAENENPEAPDKAVRQIAAKVVLENGKATVYYSYHLQRVLGPSKSDCPGQVVTTTVESTTSYEGHPTEKNLPASEFSPRYIKSGQDKGWDFPDWFAISYEQTTAVVTTPGKGNPPIQCPPSSTSETRDVNIDPIGGFLLPRGSENAKKLHGNFEDGWKTGVQREVQPCYLPDVIGGPQQHGYCSLRWEWHIERSRRR